MGKQNAKSILFLSSLIFLTALGVFLVGRELLIQEGEIFPWLWLLGFAFLYMNIVYLFLISIASLFIKNRNFPEIYIKYFPKTALCYFLRNEDTRLVYERMDSTLLGNRLPNLDFWILSDSDPEHESHELELLGRLRNKYGNRIYYRRRHEPYERKQGNIREFVESHPEYEFLYMCDADSHVPKGTVLKLLKKAAHLENQDIAIFQTFIKTRNAKTYYARFEGIAQETSQRLYFKTLQAIFGQSISFGHQCLAKRELLQRIHLPKGLLSHDNWDTALLDKMGYRVVFCKDVTTFDEVPANYVEARRRESRWSHGTLQGFPILFMKDLNPAVRFLTFYGIYCYLAQPIFLAWVFLGFLSQSYFTGALLSFRTDSVFFGRFINEGVYIMLLASLGVIFFHKLVIVKTWEGFKNFAYELFFSIFIYSGNFFYATLDLLSLPFKKLVWHPMKKNPFEKLELKQAVKVLLPGTVVGLLGIWYLLAGTPFPKLSSMPILLSLGLGIPIAYFSSKSTLARRA